MRSRAIRVVGRFGLQLIVGIGSVIGQFALAGLGIGFWLLVIFLVGKFSKFLIGLTPYAGIEVAAKPEMQASLDLLLGMTIALAGVLCFAGYVLLYSIALFVRDSWRKAISAADRSHAA